MNPYNSSMNAYAPALPGRGYAPGQQMQGYTQPQMQGYPSAQPMTTYAFPPNAMPQASMPQQAAPQLQMLDGVGMQTPGSYDIYQGGQPREGGGIGSAIVKGLADIGSAYFQKKKQDKDKAEARFKQNIQADEEAIINAVQSGDVINANAASSSGEIPFLYMGG